MATFCAGLWFGPAAPGHGALGSIHGCPLTMSWTAWRGGSGPCCWPIRVQTSWAEICRRVVLLALAGGMPRFTVAVVPSTVTLLILVSAGNAVTAGGSSTFFSHGVYGLVARASTRFLTRFDGEVPAGTNTESGTSTSRLGSKKYRSCRL